MIIYSYSFFIEYIQRFCLFKDFDFAAIVSTFSIYVYEAVIELHSLQTRGAESVPKQRLPKATDHSS